MQMIRIKSLFTLLCKAMHAMPPLEEELRMLCKSTTPIVSPLSPKLRLESIVESLDSPYGAALKSSRTYGPSWVMHRAAFGCLSH